MVSVRTSGLLAGQIDGFWLTKICGVALAYFAFRFTFPPKPQQRMTEQIDPAAGFYQI